MCDLDNLFSFFSTNSGVSDLIRCIRYDHYGYDQLNTKMICFCYLYFVSFLTQIFNKCVCKSYFPKHWKSAVVLTLPKNPLFS